MRQHERVEVERAADRLQPRQGAVAEFEAENETVGLQQVPGGVGVRPGDTARAPEDRQSHGAYPAMPAAIRE